MLSVAGCGRGSISKELRAFENTRITLPEKLVSVESGIVSDKTTPSDSLVFVIYQDRNECSSCLVAHLYDDLSTLNTISSKNCAVTVIFAPPEDESQKIIKELVELKYPFPIYIDTYDEFRFLNPDLPDDSRFHAFLLDENRKPICVGDPMVNEKVRDILYKVLDNR